MRPGKTGHPARCVPVALMVMLLAGWPATVPTAPANAGTVPGKVETEDPQFMALASGHVPADGRAEQMLHLDEDVAMAGFAVYDPTRSLRVSVRDTDGETIKLDPARPDVIAVDDPSALMHRGYGLDRPCPGSWQVTLQATETTPAAGADYTVAAQVHGGATLTARTSDPLPLPGQQVRITATLEHDGAPVPVQRALAVVRDPDGRQRTVPLAGESDLVGSWQPKRPGLHSIDVVAQGQTADGSTVERATFLAAEVQVDQQAAWSALIRRVGTGVFVALLAGTLLAFTIALRTRLHRR